MSRIHFDQILCFACVSTVSTRKIGGVDYVRCAHCGHTDTLEKAVDDCFVFSVAASIADSTLMRYSPHTYKYMPLTRDHPLGWKRRMIDSGRARSAA